MTTIGRNKLSGSWPPARACLLTTFISSLKERPRLLRPGCCPHNRGIHILFFKTTGKISRLKPKTLNRTLPLATFEAAYKLLQQMAELPGAIWLADDVHADPQNLENSSERFAAGASDNFRGVSGGKILDEFATNGRKHSEKNLHS